MVKTLTVDDQNRVQIPDARPRQVLAYERDGNGTIHLTPVEACAEEPFPAGSLTEHLTPERDQEQLAILKSCTTE